MSLTDDELAMLDLERGYWKYSGAKEEAIRDRLGISATIYFQRLMRLIQRPDVEAHDPVLVRRLRRQRDQRRAERSGLHESA